MENTNMPVISAKDLNLWYGDFKALKGISLDVGEREITALIGPSGCSKSTFLKTLNRMNDLVPNVRIEGDVRLKGEDIFAREMQLTDLRRRVGMVFQSPNVFPTSIYRNLDLPLSLAAACSRRERKERVEAALRDAGLWDEVRQRLDMPAERLSGGQQQRLCLARALVLEPDILLVDEPTAALDVHAAAGVEALLVRLAERLPVVMVSHSLAQTRRLGHTVLVMNQGRVTHCLDAAHIGGEAELSALLGGAAAE